MKKYTINKHLENILFLEEFCDNYKKELETEMFSSINNLLEFIQDNYKYYYWIENYNNIVMLLENIINYCNSEEYNVISFFKKYNVIVCNIKLILKKIIDTYKINVYFEGEDKYSLIDVILNKNVNFIGNIKEYENKLLDDLDKNNNFNILIYSEETAFNKERKYFDEVIYYDKFMNEIFIIVEQIYFKNPNYYDYNYLINSIKLAKENNIDSIIVGHSYSLNGIDESNINEKTINLSLPSQDLYYSYKIAEEVLNENNTIKNCFIGTGYWTFYFDLSRTENVNELARIEKVYYPIFKDLHNCKNMSLNKGIDLKQYLDGFYKKIFDIDRLYSFFSRIIFNKNNNSYFNDKVTREKVSLIGKNKVNSFDKDTKYRLGKERADQHNKLIHYIDSRNENIKMFKCFLEYLTKKGVRPIIVNFPTTKYYNKFLNKQIKEDYYKTLELMKNYDFTLIDLNEKSYSFTDEDYRDFDHLGLLGAKKVSKIINSNFLDQN